MESTLGGQGLLEYDGALAQAIDAAVGSGISVIDQDGRAIHVNGAFCRMLGWDREDLIGMRPPFVYWPPEEHERINASMRRAIEGRFPVDGEVLTFMRRDGRRFPVLVLLAPLLREGKAIGWVANVVDLSTQVAQAEELRLAERALVEAREASARQHTEQQLAVLLNQRIAGVGELGLDRRFISVNDRICEMTGYGRDELVGMSLNRITPPEDVMVNEGAFDRLLHGGPIQVVEKRYVRKDGSEVWVMAAIGLLRHADGRPSHFTALLVDVTDCKRYQQALKDRG